MKNGHKLSFVIEQGNKNNNDARLVYNELYLSHPSGLAFGGLSFADKDSTISLQMADLLAFYIRRYGNFVEKERRYVPRPDMVNILMRAGIRVTGLVGTEFGPAPPGSSEVTLAAAPFRRASRKGQPFD